MQKIKENQMLKYLWKTIKIIVTLFILIIIGIIITQRIFNNNVSVLGYRIFTVATGSMEPEYKVMDILFVKESKESQIKVGDDVVYLGKGGTFDGKVITHRVVEIEKENDIVSFHTKGIANDIEDPIVYYDQIYGKVIYKGVVLSFVNKIINNPIGFYLLIVIPVAILITLEIIDRKKEKDEKIIEEEILDLDE